MAIFKRVFISLTLFSFLVSFAFFYMYKNDQLHRQLPMKWWSDENVQQEELFNEDDPEFQFFCPKLSLSDEKFQENAGVKCKRHTSTVKACKYAKELFSNGLPSKKCKGIPYREICNVEFLIHNKVSILCSENVCLGDVSLLTLNPASGYLEKRENFDSVKKLQEELPHVIKDSLDKGVKFCVIVCHARGAEIKQLIQFPVIKMKQVRLDENKNKINVNIMLFDSVSRPHFYRSLPHTIEYFKEVNAQPYKHKGKIYDFEIFQAVKGRTYETVHALFTGELLPIKNPFAPNPKPVGIDVLFKKFKDKSYYTLYQEDLCWTESWGIMSDLKINKFSNLVEKLPGIAVDEMGITHSSCEILRDNGVRQPFQGPLEICLNGKYQAEYYLDYIHNMLHNAKKTSSPLLSYCAFNVGHETSAKRIQTLDKSLVENVEVLLKEHQDTISIFVADHGNTYSRYTEQIQEGKFEIFMPLLFMVIPDKVAEILGEKKMEALKLNQKRLGNVIDLHHTLMSLADLSSTPIKKQGFLEKIKENRTCDDLEMLQPNLCVCEGWDLPVTAEFTGAHAEFALGMLNNMIQDQFINGTPMAEATYGQCSRLKPLQFQNIRSRRQRGGRVVISMDLVVAAGNVVEQKTDLFHVEISSIQEPDSNSKDMKLDVFSRLTAYEGYKACVDPGVSLMLCICSRKSGLNKASVTDWQDYGSVFGRDTVVHRIYKKCLLLLSRTITNRNGGIDSVGIEIANTCNEKTFDIAVNINAINMKISSPLPVTIRLSPGFIKFVASAVKVVWYSSINLECEVTIKQDGHKVGFQTVKMGP